MQIQKRGNVFLGIIVIIMFLIIFLDFVSGFGVGIPYWETQTVPMARGEKKIFNINLQNMVGDEDLIAKIEVVEGKEMVKLGKDEYLVKSGTHDLSVPITIKIPRNATEGEHQKVKLMIKSGSAGGGGPVTLGVGAMIDFDILVTDEIIAPSIFENKFLYIIGSLIIALIVIILFVIFRRRKKKKRGGKKNKKEAEKEEEKEVKKKKK